MQPNKKFSTFVSQDSRQDWRQTLSMQLCAPLDEAVRRIPDTDAKRATEIRLRVGYPPTLSVGDKEFALLQDAVTAPLLANLLAKMSGFSLYAKQEQLRQGFLTLRGGFRAGVCASTVCQGEEVLALGQPSSINIRIMRPMVGCANLLVRRVFDQKLQSCLILSPPGLGKTTLLRDTVRTLSNRGVRVSLADERCEIAAVYAGAPTLDVGACTDVLDGCPKSVAIAMMLRAMSPQLVAADEVGSEKDAQALAQAALSGVKILATCHGDSVALLAQKQSMKPLFELFDCFAVLGPGPGEIARILGRDGRTLL